MYAGMLMSASLIYSTAPAYEPVNRALVLRSAAAFNPLDYVMRGAAARYASEMALGTGQPHWQQFARRELERALRLDPNSPDMVARLAVICSQMQDFSCSTAAMDRLKLIARAAR